MSNLSSTELFQFILAITLMLGFGKAFGELFRKMKQASVVGEIIAGIILGPTIFGLVSPDLFNFIFPSAGPVSYALEALVQLAILLLLLAVGLEVDLAILFHYGKTALITTFYSMLIPFVLGFVLAFFFPQFFIENTNEKMMFALFLGTALSISALPIIARTLLDLNIFRTRLGMMIIASAMLNDLIGWIAFSIFLSFAEKETRAIPVIYSIVLILLFTVVMIFFVRRLLNRVIPWVQKELSWPGGILGFIMILGLIGALITEQLGVHTILGAFIMGVALGDSAHLRERTREIIQQFITNIFAPLFFVYIGLKINFIQTFDPVIVIIILLIGFAGKIIGAGYGAYKGGFTKNESAAIGFSMNSRGVLEIILSLFALELGIINESIFVAIIFLVIISSVLSGPLMKLVLEKDKVKSLRNMLTSSNILFSNSTTRKEIIKEIVDYTCTKHKLNSEEVFNKVWEREEIIPTGVGNFLAVPHARIEIKKPIITIAVNSEGINFESPDKLPARIIILLLTPSNSNEIQLQLLAEIANSFNEKDFAEKLAKSTFKEEFINLLNKKEDPQTQLSNEF